MLQKKCFYGIFLLTGLVLLSGQEPPLSTDLLIIKEDMRIEQRDDGGFHLFIRKKPGLESVLIAESTKDPLLQADNYTYRVTEKNPINGDEMRILNGLPLYGSKNLGWSIVDSTPEDDAEFGAAFHLFIPHLVIYGYENTRHGAMPITDGSYFNLRAFALPYADYTGLFVDNPFTLQVSKKIPEEEAQPEGNFIQDAVDSFRDITASGEGLLVWATDPDQLVERIRSIIEPEKGKALDLVLCIDTTGSMSRYIAAVRRLLTPLLQNMLSDFLDLRIGMVLYKDYKDLYITRIVPFTRDFSSFQQVLNTIVTGGGGIDIPEAVYEALYDGASRLIWEAPERLMILIGDAPAHPSPKGNISKESVDTVIAEQGITVHAIILPQ
ncbi:MAG: VWA domain-containing protein [Spirochaetaceae bacterium]|jgi:hypothetical protein|nr:VWA domain-containing protein [Spirochaetaceae bacterium]